jgi:L-asparaginase II
MNPVLVQLWRGPCVESRHRGSVAVLDAAGAVVFERGDIDARVFPRSAVKLLQALPLVASGAAERFGLSDAELALACASHNGEQAHVLGAASALAHVGLDEAVLECGSHWPYLDLAQRALLKSGQSPCPLHNNCSGKHAGFICLGAHIGKPEPGSLAGYVKPEHPVMREVGAALEATTGERLSEAPMGTDGCSIPTYALPLRSLALAFARVAAGQGLSPEHTRAARRLREAIAREPFMVAGTARFDTELMKLFGEAVCCKVGAEGVYCAALPTLGLGVALKIDDGNTARAAEVAMAALVQRLLPMDEAQAAFIASRVNLSMRNWRGIEVGRLQAAEALLQSMST